MRVCFGMIVMFALAGAIAFCTLTLIKAIVSAVNEGSFAFVNTGDKSFGIIGVGFQPVGVITFGMFGVGFFNFSMIGFGFFTCFGMISLGGIGVAVGQAAGCLGICIGQLAIGILIPVCQACFYMK